MKKILLGASALIAVLPCYAHAADPIQLSINGYMSQWFGYGTSYQTDNTIDVGFQNSSELQFKGKTTLDNGITVGVQVELAGEHNSSDQIDEAYLTISGGFGEIRLGNEDGALGMITGTSEVGATGGANDSGASDWIAGVTSPSASKTLGGDASKIRYTTPDFGGFKAAVSYSPTGHEDTLGDGVQYTDAAEGTAKLNNIADVMVNYDADFGSFNLGVGLSYGFAESEAPKNVEVEDRNVLNFGAKIGVGPVTISGAYAVAMSGSTYDNGVTISEQGYGYAFAGKYEQGPVALSLGYAYDIKEADVKVDSEDENHNVTFGASYDFGAGVSFNSSLGWAASYGEEVNETRNGLFAVTGFTVSF